MKYVIDIPEYDPLKGFRFEWEDNIHISIKVDGKGAITIAANPDGLISLARHLLVLAQTDIPKGYHFHLDSSNSLEVGSHELIIERE
jgi:hypothetical protein